MAIRERAILGVGVAASSYAEVVRKSVAWARGGESRVMVFANVHVLMEAHDDPAYGRVLGLADMVNPDGMPLVWALRRLGCGQASRVYGPDCMLAMMRGAEAQGVSVGFFGGTPLTLDGLLRRVRGEFPKLQIAFSLSPPFREMTDEEDAVVVRRVEESGARILFVGLGCPKQERWMIEHRERIPAVMFGVGAAFDFLAGTKRQAPRWMMAAGLEWAFRLAMEPRRLARRYLWHNPRFVLLVARQIWRERMRVAGERETDLL